eukprot:TRINITY_DN4285_c0_g1_i2.p1 TRINITY_DN4285_c0_g1~~TRINITY_DN4285_c0_g1_i2.p1  ORF type:complete len:148 (-),score=2.17 TRINITY_DN4285_c0_g1_i2:54-497(-)
MRCFLVLLPGNNAGLAGGKGGFGTLMRKQKSKTVTTNFDSCRGLDGRRLRSVRNEQSLNIWKPKEETKTTPSPAVAVQIHSLNSLSRQSKLNSTHTSDLEKTEKKDICSNDVDFLKAVETFDMEKLRKELRSRHLNKAVQKLKELIV